MKKFLGNVRKTMREYWSRLMQSPDKKMTRGAENIDKTISRARGENWRRKEVKK